MSETCGLPHPSDDSMTCDKPAHPFGAHMHRESATVWQGIAPPVRKGGKSRLADLVAGCKPETRTGPPRVGPPPEAVKQWSTTQEQWLVLAKGALKHLCETQEEFTTGALWPLVDNPRERRAMVIVVRHGLRSGWMQEVGARRETEEWRTRDGVSFPMNKLVPVYRSLLAQK